MKEEIRGSSVLILGYGREGQSVHRFLRKTYPTVQVGIADLAPVKPIFAAYRVHTGEDYLEAIAGYDTIIRSPGIPLYLPRYNKFLAWGRHITTASNIFFSRCRGKVIGVTGTKGKSTTSSLIYSIAKEKHSDVRLVGNIGKPALDALISHTQKTIFVFEFSSHQLEDFRYSPQIAVLLAVYPEHFDHFATFTSYINAKNRLILYQSARDQVVYNPVHSVTRQFIQQSRARRVIFSLTPQPEADCWVEGETVWIKNNAGRAETVMPVAEIPLLGQGNVENTLAAVAVGVLLNVAVGDIRSAVKKFRSLPHRLEKIGTYRGITFYNDSLSTVPESTIHALAALKGRVSTLIAGGMDRGLSYDVLGSYLTDYPGLATLILFPDTGRKIWEAIKKHSRTRPKFVKYETSSMAEAVRLAYQYTPRRSVCLLSPGAASFNLFKDYQERGEVFRQSVQKYAYKKK